jgi:hypothetical protein
LESQIIISFKDQIDRETDHNECTSSANIIFILTMVFFLSRNYIAGKWYGFIDPQSGLHSMTWRAGTKSELDDIITSTHLPISALIIEPNLSKPLPIGRRIFITVRIYNKAGIASTFKRLSSIGTIWMQKQEQSEHNINQNKTTKV